MRWLLNHGANASAQSDSRQTPLHQATFGMDLGAIQVLLERKVDINLQDNYGYTPLRNVLAEFSLSQDGKAVEIVRRLLEHGADPNIRLTRCKGLTPLHQASYLGSLESTRLLLSYGANIDEKDDKGKTPFQVASSGGHDEIMQLLLKQGALSP